jgi:large subunit ribosomal protein L9e
MDKTGKKINVEVWFGTSKHIAAIRTICTHIHNMQVGVTKGFEYKMRFVYAHYPVNVNISEDGKTFEVRNFIGQKVVLRTQMLDGVIVERSQNKDEVILRGNDIENVTSSAAQIHQSTKVRNKDIRKFLDGIYVSEGGPIEA